MAQLAVPRGLKRDIPFVLRDRVGGNLVDNYNWAGGATAGEWPTVVIKNGALVDKTADFDIDIAAEVLPGGSIKHPTTTTGIWRLSTGRYRLRVQPIGGLSLGNYTITVAFNSSVSVAYTEPHDLALVESGDVEFDDLVFTSLTWEDYTSIITSSITDPAIQESIMDEIAATVEGDLQLCGIDTSQWDTLPKYIRSLLLSYGRVTIQTYDAGAGLIVGPVSEIQEGSERIKYAVRASSVLSPIDDYTKRLNLICRRYGPGRQPFIGTIVRPVGMTVNDDNMSPEFTGDYGTF